MARSVRSCTARFLLLRSGPGDGSGLERESNQARRRSGDGPARIFGQHSAGASIVASWTYGLVVLVAGAAIAAIASLDEAGDGFLWPSYLLLGLSMVTLCVGIGHLAGRLLPVVLSSAVAAAAVFVLGLFIGDAYGNSFLYVLSGPVHNSNAQTDFQTIFGEWSIATSMATAVMNITSGEPICSGLSPEQETAFFQASFDLVEWLSAYLFGGPRPAAIQGGPPGVDRGAIEALIRQPLEEQKNWAQDRLDQHDTICP